MTFIGNYKSDGLFEPFEIGYIVTFEEPFNPIVTITSMSSKDASYMEEEICTQIILNSVVPKLNREVLINAFRRD